MVICQEMSVQETHRLVFGDSKDFDEGHMTIASPMGRALIGKGVGDSVFLKLVARTRRLRILELKTITRISAPTDHA